MNISNKTVKIVLSAIVAALTTVATMIIKFPIIGTTGYVNVGDTVIMLAVWCLGGGYIAIAAGIGSALADLLLVYSVYIPGTFVIKSLMAIIAYMIISSTDMLNKYIRYFLSGIVAETIMVLGYFVYEWTFLGLQGGAVLSITGNVIQGISCLVLAMFGIILLEQSKLIAVIEKYKK